METEIIQGLRRWRYTTRRVCADETFLPDNSRTSWLRRRRTLRPYRWSRLRLRIFTMLFADSRSTRNVQRQQSTQSSKTGPPGPCKYYHRHTTGTFLRHLARRSHHICICGRRRFRGDAWTAGVGDRNTTPEKRSLSALVIIRGARRRKVPPLLEKCVPTRTRHRRKSKESCCM